MSSTLRVVDGFIRPAERMDIFSVPGTEVVFDARGGYDSDQRLALEVLKLGTTYIVEHIRIGDFSSDVKLRGVAGFWNTMLFAIKENVAGLSVKPVHVNAKVELRPGEQYLGPILNKDGSIAYHLVKLPDIPTKPLNHDEAIKWAAEVGGKLPDRREVRLLQANSSIFNQDWCWLEETLNESLGPENANQVWTDHALAICFFYGSVYSDDRKNEGGAIAVRRIH